MERRVFFALVTLTALCAAIFAFWPKIDLMTARAFYADGAFPLAHSRTWQIARKAGYWGPGALLVLYLLRYAIQFSRGAGTRALGRSTAFIALSMALGPGLLVNVILKDHSHRPRPVQVREFGGSDQFEPWYRFDGACVRNCSFVSGEASAAFWTTAPALLAPPPIRIAAVGVALAFGVCVSVLRLGFGGHFLSDVIFAALFTLMIVTGLARAFAIPQDALEDSGARRLRKLDPPL